MRQSNTRTHREREGQKRRGATEKGTMGKRRRRILEVESCFGRVGEREREKERERETREEKRERWRGE